MLTCWVFDFNDFVFQSQPGRLNSPAVMMNALVMLSALFMLLSMVFAELNTIPTKRTQRSRKIPLYEKTNWENIKVKLKMIKEEIREALVLSLSY
jgi:hypothetical protein